MGMRPPRPPYLLEDLHHGRLPKEIHKLKRICGEGTKHAGSCSAGMDGAGVVARSGSSEEGSRRTCKTTGNINESIATAAALRQEAAPQNLDQYKSPSAIVFTPFSLQHLFIVRCRLNILTSRSIVYHASIVRRLYPPSQCISRLYSPSSWAPFPPSSPTSSQNPHPPTTIARSAARPTPQRKPSTSLDTLPSRSAR